MEDFWSYTFFFYDSANYEIYTIKVAIEQAGSMDNDAIIAAMTEITVSGVTGEMTFSEDGEPNKAARVAVIQDGQYVGK